MKLSKKNQEAIEVLKEGIQDLKQMSKLYEGMIVEKRVNNLAYAIKCIRYVDKHKGDL